MKNTSLWFFGQCQRTPSAEPAARKLLSATDLQGL
nr:MAG TPA: hypothetical protein [Microviridae sp.]